MENLGSWESADVLGAVPLLLGLATVPSRLVRSISYRLWRRNDWNVTVYAGVQGDYRPHQAVLHETWPDKAAAAGRAETLWTRLTAYDTLDGE